MATTGTSQGFNQNGEAIQMQQQQPQQGGMVQVVTQPVNVTIVTGAATGDVGLCTPGCGCCTFATMITFMVVFLIELIFVASFDSNTDYDKDTWDNGGYATSQHYIEFMVIFYILLLVITSIFLAVFVIKKLW
eukprot:CAMPEP_0197029294 /NCGR_PEP_ID=MMETSP1384-20130603/8774_1 /TAXON_ID=29189 /ORGANISM="Ammonia sp." /LENGTH=132 /DNA_ID=CAMNT_0042458431 /DNA_START=54 /DNA_END=449 /DNA_ORIENTATION=+